MTITATTRAPGAPAHPALTLLVDNARQRKRRRESHVAPCAPYLTRERDGTAGSVGGDNNRLDNSFVFSAGCSLGTVYRKYRASTNVFTDVSDWSREFRIRPGEMGKRNDDRCLERMKPGLQFASLVREPSLPSVHPSFLINLRVTRRTTSLEKNPTVPWISGNQGTRNTSFPSN